MCLCFVYIYVYVHKNSPQKKCLNLHIIWVVNLWAILSHFPIYTFLKFKIDYNYFYNQENKKVCLKCLPPFSAKGEQGQ